MPTIISLPQLSTMFLEKFHKKNALKLNALLMPLPMGGTTKKLTTSNASGVSNITTLISVFISVNALTVTGLCIWNFNVNAPMINAFKKRFVRWSKIIFTSTMDLAHLLSLLGIFRMLIRG